MFVYVYVCAHACTYINIYIYACYICICTRKISDGKFSMFNIRLLANKYINRYDLGC